MYTWSVQTWLIWPYRRWSSPYLKVNTIMCSLGSASWLLGRSVCSVIGEAGQGSGGVGEWRRRETCNRLRSAWEFNLVDRNEFSARNSNLSFQKSDALTCFMVNIFVISWFMWKINPVFYILKSLLVIIMECAWNRVFDDAVRSSISEAGLWIEEVRMEETSPECCSAPL